MKSFGKLLKGALVATVASSALIACSNAGGGDSASTGGGTTDDGLLEIAGTLGLSAQPLSTVNPFAITLSDLEIYAICLASTPDIAQGDVSAAGAFSVKLDCPAGSIVTAIFRNKTSEESVATVTFEDSSKLDINGNPKKSSAFALNGDVSVGTIILNEETGEVTIPISQITSSTDEAVDTGSDDGSSHDMNGQWTLDLLPTASLPDGYSNACADANNDGNADDVNCHGPTEGESVNFRQINGTEWNRDAQCVTDVENDNFSGTCGGSAGTGKKSIIMMFNSPDSITDCNGKTGFTEQMAKAYAGVYIQNSDLTGTGLTIGSHTFSADLGDGWKNPNAKLEWDMHNCRPFDLTGSAVDGNTNANTILNGSKMAWACRQTAADDVVGAEGGVAWRVGAGGGCMITGTSTPVMVKNWTGSNLDAGNSTNLTLPQGWNGGVNAYTSVDHDDDAGTAAVSVTCKYLSAMYTEVNSAPGALVTSNTSDGDNNNTDNEFGTDDVITNGTACSAIGGGTSLQALQCYANFYWQYHERGEAVPDMNNDADTTDAGEGVQCARKMSFDYGTQLPQYFADTHSNWSSGQDFVGLMSVNGDNFTVEDEPRVDSRGVDTGDGWVPCRVSSTGRISFTKKSATQYVIEYTRTGLLVDQGKPACVAAAKDPDMASDMEIGTQKFMFLLNK